MWSGFCPSECSSRVSTPRPFTLMAGHIVEVQHMLPAGTSEIGQQSDWHRQWCCEWRRCWFLLDDLLKCGITTKKSSLIRTWWPCGPGLSHRKKMFLTSRRETRKNCCKCSVESTLSKSGSHLKWLGLWVDGISFREAVDILLWSHVLYHPFDSTVSQVLGEFQWKTFVKKKTPLLLWTRPGWGVYQETTNSSKYHYWIFETIIVSCKTLSDTDPALRRRLYIEQFLQPDSVAQLGLFFEPK